MSLSRTRTYRNIAAKVRFFGLELGDWGALAAVTGLLFSVMSKLLINMTAVALLGAWMKFIKAKKPEGFTGVYLSFLGSPKTLLCEQEIRHD